jgi:1-acyl-sn-glycerol-3-phosphate acyltransferase
MQLFRSVLFTCYLFAATLIYGIVVLLMSWLPHKYVYAIARSWASNQLRVLKGLCGLGYVVEGRENIPPGTHISMWKHTSAWETIAQTVVFPPQAWVLKRELLQIPVVGWAIKCLKPISIDRAARRSAVGLWVVIFPEGTRVLPGEKRPYGIGGALLAAKTGCKIVPVAHDAGDYWQRRGWIKKPGTIKVLIGPPIECAGRDARAINSDAQEWIECALTRLRVGKAPAQT